MNLNTQQWLMIAVVVGVFIALCILTRRAGEKFDRRFQHPPGE